jgi:hypothetical protein
VGKFLLTREEVSELTGRTQHAAQVRALRSMGIEHLVRPDSTIAVSHAHVERLLGGAGGAGVRMKATEPDWSSLAAPQTQC